MRFFGMFNNKDEKPAMGQFANKGDSSNYEIASDITSTPPSTEQSAIQSTLKTKYDINEDTIFPS
jgi:hypothetical protein